MTYIIFTFWFFVAVYWVHLGYFWYDYSVLKKIAREYHGEYFRNLFRVQIVGLTSTRNFQIHYEMLGWFKMYKLFEISVPLQNSAQPTEGEIAGLSLRPFYFTFEKLNASASSSSLEKKKFPHHVALPEWELDRFFLISGYPRDMLPQVIASDVFRWGLKFDYFRLSVEPQQLKIQLFDLRVRKRAMMMILKELQLYAVELEKI